MVSTLSRTHSSKRQAECWQQNVQLDAVADEWHVEVKGKVEVTASSISRLALVAAATELLAGLHWSINECFKAARLRAAGGCSRKMDFFYPLRSPTQFNRSPT